MNEEVNKLEGMKIKKIECTYDGHCTIDVEDLASADYFARGKVKDFWVKYGTLYIMLDDGTRIEEDVTHDVSITYDTIDTKRPTSIMIQDREDNWHRKDGELIELE